MDQYKYRSIPKPSKYFSSEKQEYAPSRYSKYLQNQSQNYNSQFPYKDLEKSTYTRVSTKYEPYEDESLAKRSKQRSILRNTTNVRPTLDYNREIDMKNDYNRKYEKKNLTIANEMPKSKHYIQQLGSQSHISAKYEKATGLNSYLSHKDLSVGLLDESTVVSPHKRKYNENDRVERKQNFLETSKFRENQSRENERSRRKLMQRYQQVMGSKSAKQFDSNQYLDRPSYQVNDYRKDYKVYDTKYQHSTSVLNGSNKNNTPKSLRDLSFLNKNPKEERQHQYYVSEETKADSRLPKKRNQLEGYRSLDNSRYELDKSKVSVGLLPLASSKSKGDLPRYQVQTSKPSSFIKQSSFYQPQKPKLSIYDFNIGKSKGQGKFGTVYAAIHKATGTIYALKKISKEMIRSHLMESQIALEIKLQLFFDHPNIVKLYGFFDDREHIYLILEYMEEGTLFESLRRRVERMPQKEVIQRIKEMSMAIKYLHELGVAHRDIKPQNIVLSNGISKLCDFGWATLCNDRRKTYCGTFDYAAPEILEGKQYDWGVDLWCIGVLTFELLVGKVPFYHISRKQTMKKILRVDRDQIVFPSDISWKAKDFIEGLIKKDPEQRTASDKLLDHPFLKQEKDTKF